MLAYTLADPPVQGLSSILSTNEDVLLVATSTGHSRLLEFPAAVPMLQMIRRCRAKKVSWRQIFFQFVFEIFIQAQHKHPFTGARADVGVQRGHLGAGFFVNYFFQQRA